MHYIEENILRELGVRLRFPIEKPLSDASATDCRGHLDKGCGEAGVTGDITAHLASVTVHAADEYPPWATREARIDLARARHPHFADLRTRRGTLFARWSFTGRGIDASNVALAGFFIERTTPYSLQCFYCGLERGLHDLRSGDNIWDEHARLSPHCTYLQAVMGPEDIGQAVDRISNNTAHITEEGRERRNISNITEEESNRQHVNTVDLRSATITREGQSLSTFYSLLD